MNLGFKLGNNITCVAILLFLIKKLRQLSNERTLNEMNEYSMKPTTVEQNEHLFNVFNVFQQNQHLLNSIIENT